MPLVPLAPGLGCLRIQGNNRRCHVMSILNTTPDSFSDGGSNSPADIGALRATAALHIASGATIIDVGGQSSRPNAPSISAEEELSRVIPAIEAVKSLPEAAGVAISVDTYRAEVAEAAVNAGAHIVNDVSAGLLDPNMLSTVARLGCTYIMMHMRGTPATMSSEENCSYPDGLEETMRKELSERLRAAEAAGIRRWRIILDPGLGFAKTQAQNLRLLSPLRKEFMSHGVLRDVPWLVGASRKSFIGAVTGVKEAKNRQWGTAAAVTAAVLRGANIVRVHDVREMAQVVKMAEAMYGTGTERYLNL